MPAPDEWGWLAGDEPEPDRFADMSPTERWVAEREEDQRAAQGAYTVYPVLDRLTENGWITARQETEPHPSRPMPPPAANSAAEQGKTPPAASTWRSPRLRPFRERRLIAFRVEPPSLVSVWGPRDRVPESRFAELGAQARQATRDISERLAPGA